LRHVIAEAFEMVDEASSRVFRLKMVEKVGPGLAVGFPAWEHLRGHDQDGVGHRYSGALLATAWRAPPVWCLPSGALGPRGGACREPGPTAGQAPGTHSQHNLGASHTADVRPHVHAW
jgi:hypothetical protein